MTHSYKLSVFSSVKANVNSDGSITFCPPELHKVHVIISWDELQHSYLEDRYSLLI